jgi:formate-dependent nitrite reductase cytochrome c552 subunit
MKRRVGLVTCTLLGFAVVIGVVASLFGPGLSWTDRAEAAPPPLVVDKDAPLLLDDPPEEPGPEMPDENQACYVCHTNYEEEPLAVWHGEEDVACIDCHGKSFAHRNDEDNITPPDVMYPPEKIAKKCAECHETHDAPAVEVIALWQQRCPEKTDPKSIVCTDCHGQHRLKLRTVRWNKRTGELIVRDVEKDGEGE